MVIPKTNELPESDARHHAMNLERALKDLAEHARDDIAKVTDPRGQVLLATTADVLLGLAKAHADFARGEENGMRTSA